MDVREGSLARRARLKSVEAHRFCCESRENLDKGLVLLGRKGDVHEAAYRSPEQTPAGDQDVQADKKRDDGIEHVPFRRDHKAYPQDDADGCDHVGPQMPPVCDERRRTPAPPGPHQRHCDYSIDDRGGDGYRQTRSEIVDRGGANDPSHGAHHDETCRDEDHRPLDGGGEVLGFRSAESKLGVRGFGGLLEGDERYDGGREVDHGFGRVREQAHRAGHEVGRRLHRDRGCGGDHGKPGVAAEIFGGGFDCHQSILRVCSGPATEEHGKCGAIHGIRLPENRRTRGYDETRAHDGKRTHNEIA